MSKSDYRKTSIVSAGEGDELALRIGELDLFMLLFGIAMVFAVMNFGGSRHATVPISPSRAGTSATAGYADKPIVVQVKPEGLTVGSKFIRADQIKELKEISGRTVLVEPEQAPEVDRMLRALSGLRDAGAAVHVTQE